MNILMRTFLPRKLRVIRVRVFSHLTGCILILVPGEKYGDPSDGVWSMYLTEAEKQDKDVTENWKGDTDGILVFVSLTLSSVYSPAETDIEDWSVLRHRRHLHYRKLSEPISQSQRYDQCAPWPNNSTASQHLQRHTSHNRRSAEQSAIQTNSVRRQGQRAVVPQFGPQLELRAFRNTDAAMGPTI